VVFLCNAILVTEIFCYQYLTINNSAKKSYLSTKFGIRFSNILELSVRSDMTFLLYNV